MKKNLSFLSKVGVTAASVALVAGFAWAAPDPDPTDNILTVPTAQIKAGDQVTFVGFNNVGVGMYMKSDAQNADDFYSGISTIPGSRDKFTVRDNADNTFSFVGTGDPAPYVKDAAAVKSVLNDFTDEVKWNISDNNVVTSLSGAYLYFDRAQNRFQTSASANPNPVMFVTAPVKRASIYDEGGVVEQYAQGAEVTKMVGTLGEITLKYDAFSQNNPEIKVRTNQAQNPNDNFCVVYKVTGDTEWNTDWSDEISIDLSQLKGEITVTAATASWVMIDGVKKILEVTQATSADYTIVNMTPTLVGNVGVLEKTGSTAYDLTRNANGYAHVDFNATSHTSGINYYYGLGEGVEPTTSGTNSGQLYVATTSEETPQTQFTPETRYVTVKNVYDDFVSQQTFTVTVKSFLQHADLNVFEPVYTIGAGEDAPAPGSEISVEFNNNASSVITEEHPVADLAVGFNALPQADKKFKVNYTVNGVAKEAFVDATVDGTSLKFEVPADYIPNSPLSVTMPVGSFLYTRDQNSYTCDATTIEFNLPYTGAMYQVDKEHEFIYKEKASAADGFIIDDITVICPNGEKAAILPGKAASVVTPDGTPVVDATVTLSDPSVLTTFKVSLPSGIAEGDYMIVFPAYSLTNGTIGEEGATINKTNVNAYISVREKADITFDLSLANGVDAAYKDGTTYTFCENDMVYIKVNAKGHFNHDVVVASIVGDILVDGEALTEVAIVDNYILVGNAKDLDGKTITVADKAIKANNSYNSAVVDMQVVAAPHVAWQTSFNAFAKGTETKAYFDVLDENFNLITAANYTETAVTINGVACKVKVEAGKGTITVTASGKNVSNIKDRETIVIPAEKMQTSCGQKNQAINVTVKVDQQVKLYIDESTLVKKYSTDVEEINFNIATAPLGRNVIKTVADAKFFLRHYETGKEYALNVDKVDGTSGNFTATLIKNGDYLVESNGNTTSLTNLVAGNYFLCIPAYKLQAELSLNADLQAMIQVKNEIEFNAPETVRLNDATPSFDIELTATDVVEEMDETANMAALLTGWTVNNEAVAKVEVARDADKKTFHVTLKDAANAPVALAQNAILTIPAGKLSANFSENEPINIALNVAPIVNFINDATDALVDDEVFTIKVTANGEDFEIDEEVLAATPVQIQLGSDPAVNVEVAKSATAGCLEITLPTTVVLAESQVYTVKVPANALTSGNDANGAINATVTILPVTEFNVNNLNTTATVTPGTYGRIDLNRGNSSTNYQAICVPFSMSAADVADQFDIIKLNTITEQDGPNGAVVCMYYHTLKAPEKTVANRPYIIKPKAATDIEVSLYNSEIKTPADEANSILDMYTASTKYDFMPVVNWHKFTAAEAEASDMLVLSGGNYQKVVANREVKPWTWYIKTTGRGFDYVRVFVDDVEVDAQATGINDIIINSNDNSEIYDLNGRRLNEMKKGINIVNGVKVYKK